MGPGEALVGIAHVGLLVECRGGDLSWGVLLGGREALGTAIGGPPHKWENHDKTTRPRS